MRIKTLIHNSIKLAISASMLSLSLAAVAEPVFHFKPYETIQIGGGSEAGPCHITFDIPFAPNPYLAFTGIHAGKTKNILEVNGVKHIYGVNESVVAHGKLIDYMCFSAGSLTNITNELGKAVTMTCEGPGMVSLCVTPSGQH